MIFYVNRGDVVQSIINELRSSVATLNLVRPYQGEFSRYEKKAQITQGIFPAEVNLTTPFALVSSQDRPVVEQKNRRVKLRHSISVFIGVANNHDFSSTAIPESLPLLELCAAALVGKKFHSHASELSLENDGTFLTTTDLFVVYEQKFFQIEPADA